ncbi:MAG: HEAT repeat domain-containing protein, partial [Planctomycetes bacterium]|nr:HEAT repeat domain-containing protein [Planctomycetota bacterium]
PKTCVPALTELLGHEYPIFRETVVVALGNFGADAKSARPRLEQMLRLEVLLGRDPNRGLAKLLSETLKKINSDE